jgi:MFS family permease
MVAMMYSMFDEAFPLWALTDPKSGGLGFLTNDLGFCYVATGVYLVFFQLVIYTRLANRFGPRWCFCAGLLCASVIFFLFPFLSRISNLPRWAFWIIILFGVFANISADTMAFTSSHILVNMVAPKNAGKANGIAYSIAAATRSMIIYLEK